MKILFRCPPVRCDREVRDCDEFVLCQTLQEGLECWRLIYKSTSYTKRMETESHPGGHIYEGFKDCGAVITAEGRMHLNFFIDRHPYQVDLSVVQWFRVGKALFVMDFAQEIPVGKEFHAGDAVIVDNRITLLTKKKGRK